MVSVAQTYRLPLTALLLGMGIVVTFLFFWILNNPLSTWTGVDLDSLFLPLAVWACLLLLSRFFVYGRIGLGSDTNGQQMAILGTTFRAEAPIGSGVDCPRSRTTNRSANHDVRHLQPTWWSGTCIF